MLNKLLQPENAELPIDVTFPRKVIVCKLMQLTNADDAMEVIVDGIVTDLNFEQYLKASSAIEDTFSGKTKSPSFPGGNLMSLVLSLLKSTPSSDV